MAYVNHRVIAPVSIYDVQRALGVSSGDLGTLCKHTNINLWARYKPIRYECIGPVTFATRKNLTHDGVSTPFGVLPPWCGLLDIMNQKVWSLVGTGGDISNGWQYLKPRGDRTPQGGFKEFYRLTDFVREPSEMTPSANGDPTPANLKGYNHNAKLPFYPVFSMAGVTEEYNGTDGYYLQINKQISNTLSITFYNAIGDDLHLQDFIDIAYASGNIKWRPVLQAFDDYYSVNAPGSNPNDRLPWYQRDNLGTNDKEVSGPVISADDSVTVELSLNDFSLNQLYHLCIGVGCCDQSTPLVWKSGSDSLFIMPFSEAQYEADDFPFYKKFKVVSYMARHMNVISLKYYQSGRERWVDATGQTNMFTIDSLALQQIRIAITINKLPSQAVDFMPVNSSASHPNQAMIIQAREMITGEMSQNTIYLTPTNSSWEPQNYVTIPAGQESDTVTLYATMQIGTGVPPIPVGGYGEYHFYADTGGQQMDNIGYMSIHMIQYSNS